MNTAAENTALTSDPGLLAKAFCSFLPSDAVLTEEEDLRPYECDGLSAYRCLPMIVVLPDTTDQVCQILRLCSEHNTPIVARGAGTGLSGGSLPASDGVLLSLAKFNRILDIDLNNRCATVQPGVRNLAVSEAVEPYELFYAPDPSSQIACSIGGNIAENSGGVHCLKYGLTVHNLLEVKVVTIDGELLTIGSKALDNPGYDLLALMTGSEGMLGVIVEATLKLLPKPESAQVVMASFDTVKDAGDAVAGIIASGIIPAGLEMMDSPAIRAAEDFVHAGYPRDAAAMLLCELDGIAPEVEEQIEQVCKLLKAHNTAQVRIAQDAQERARFWAGRKASFASVGRISPDYYCMDGTIPRKHLARVLARISELSEQFDLRVTNVFHAGDGNLHPLILYDANASDQLERAEAFGSKISELCIEVGGTITGEHGVGMEKLDQMCVQFRTGELAQFHAVKAAFDPKGLLNPGKAVPTLHRCAEFGAMHVHFGQVPYPELPRF